MSNFSILLSTTDEIPGYRITEYRGLVFGITVRSRGMGGDCTAGCQSCAGGEVSAYTSVVLDSRNEALNRMVADAQARGANAIVGIRIDNDQLGQGANTGVVAMGTAVIVTNM
ncbi:MAG: YbjQ family protein [Promethearchaeota archaeon]